MTTYKKLHILMSMSKNRRLQIPVTEAEERVLRSAARRAGLPFAKWARKILQQKAIQGTDLQDKEPMDALESLFRIEASVSTVDQMINESYDDRYKD